MLWLIILFLLKRIDKVSKVDLKIKEVYISVGENAQKCKHPQK